MNPRPPGLLISCEHAFNAVPEAWRPLFAGSDARADLDSHRGWDPGAFPIARQLADLLQAPLIHGQVSRLLVELNRSPGSPQIWSEYSGEKLPRIDRETLIIQYYQPYLEKLREKVEHIIATAGVCLHLSIHTFTPVLGGRQRQLDIGILFDLHRELESRWASAMHDAFTRYLPQFRCHYNQPYLGTDDGLTVWLRNQFANKSYAGIELEFSQALWLPDSCEKTAALRKETISIIGNLFSEYSV